MSSSPSPNGSVISGVLSGVYLQVENVERFEEFYSNYFGMSKIREDHTAQVELGFPGSQDMKLIISPISASSKSEEPKLPSPINTSNETYWKIGLGLDDVQRAVDILKESSVIVGSPKQFLDVGYLTKVTDSEGLTLELLQNTMEKNFKERPASPDQALGQPGPLHVGQLTLRTSEPIEKVLAFYVNFLGMKLMAIEEVPAYNFDLYFLAFATDDKEEVPPVSEDLKSPENREWLYQRPYTTLEIQHCRSRPINNFVDLEDDPFPYRSRFLGYQIKIQGGLLKEELVEKAKSMGQAITELENVESVVVRDPNNVPITILF